MDRKSVVLKYFQKAGSLSTKNPNYCRIISSLFQWLITNDQVKNDLSSNFFFQRKTLAGSGKIIAHDDIIIAGLDEIVFLLNKYTQLSIAIYIKDGQKAKKEEILAEISGNIYQILAYERTTLNILQRMSGIATETNHLINLIKHQSSNISHQPFIAATRKTPWGLLDKKAVAVGGGLTHRLNLADGILIKDNHLIALKKEYRLKTNDQVVVKALEIINRKNTSDGVLSLPKDSSEVKESKRKLIEIEVETENQAFTAVETFKRLANNHYHLAIMFDNFSPSQIKKIASSIPSLSLLQSPLPCKFHEFTGPIIFEASGGITKKNILSFAQTGVDIISLGSLTHSPQAANLSLEIA